MRPRKQQFLSWSAAVRDPEVGKGLGLLKAQRKDCVAGGVAHWVLRHCHPLHLKFGAAGGTVDCLAGMGCNAQTWGLQISRDLFDFTGQSGDKGEGRSLCT